LTLSKARLTATTSAGTTSTIFSFKFFPV
jgi:hypothetical protein